MKIFCLDKIKNAGLFCCFLLIEIYGFYSINGSFTYIYLAFGRLFIIIILFSRLYLLFQKNKKLLEQSQEKILRLEAIVEQCPSSIVITDPRGNIEYVNPMFTKVTGYAKDEVLGKNPRILKSGETSQEEYKELWKTIHSGKQWYGQFHNKKKSQELYWELASISPIFNAQGKISHFFAIKQDITEFKKIQTDLLYAKQAAEMANKSKSLFLANMSHEIRTPMNAIMGMADLLWESPLNQDQKQYVQIFKNAGESLLSLINDILDLSKIEAGHCQLESIDFDLEELIKQIGEVMALKAHKKKLEFLCHITPGTPVRLLGDPLRLRQVLMNLIGNAIKFTDSGEILLRICSNPKSQTPGNLLFSIFDTGIGIPKDKQSKIFENFVQADSFIGKHYGGTGLGLSISKKIVEMMQGKIWLESEDKHGSVFSFTAQLGLSPASTSQIEAFDLKSMKILVVDDHPISRLILREILEGWGAVVNDAKDAKEAFLYLKQSKKDSQMPCEVLLLDSQMPGLDGFELAKQIGKDFGLLSHTILMLNADNRSEEISKSKEIGISFYITKPVNRVDLHKTISLLAGWGSLHSKKMPILQDTSMRQKETIKILLVDDSEDNHLLMQAYLRNKPYSIDIAENGQVALEKFYSNSYSLVLMDIQMPVMDGHTATKGIRKYELEKKLAPTPIVALTAYALKEEMEKCLQDGCNAHLSKPIKKAELLSAIEKYINPK
ncbi:MAG: response regulator [Candidatus Brocadiae bacterium]|nr:response regulator [Candidatus Brocadiia bacterium]